MSEEEEMAKKVFERFLMIVTVTNQAELRRQCDCRSEATFVVDLV